MIDDLARLGRLIRKELSEILRDRRTIITLVLMPLLLYPLLSVAFQQFYLASRLAPAKGVVYELGFVSEKDYELLNARIHLDQYIVGDQQPPVDKQPPDKSQPKVAVKARHDSLEELEKALRDGRLDAILRAVRPAGKTPRRPPSDGDRVTQFEVVYVPNAPGALGALVFLEQRLAAVNQADLLRRLNVPGIRPRSNVVSLSRAPLEETGSAGAIISLAALVPLILILMTITGAVYPAIDLTAGERERGTLEILVAAPVPRMGLLFAKYVSVVAVAVLTALVNLVAMTSTLLLSGLGPMLLGGQSFSIWTIIQIFGLLLLFAAFFSAVLLCLTSFARSFKEAQAYLIPLMLVSLAPGVMGMIPGLKLTDWAAMPLVNIVLLGRDLIDGNAELGPTFVVIVATLAYALAALGLAARIFGSENVLYNEQSSWADLFRQPAEPQAYASVSAALWCLALMIPVNFVLQGTPMLLVQRGLLERSAVIFLGPPQSLLLFGALPALFAWRGRLHMASAFALRPASWPAYSGGILLGLSLWPILFLALSWMNLNLMEDRFNEHFEQIIDSFKRLAPPVKIVLVAVPAILEEWFFRGYVYGALRQRSSGAVTIVTTAALFSLAHFVFRMELGWERLLPSAALGLVLGTVREASGSVWPGMLLHACHNSCLILLTDSGAGQETTIPIEWVVAGAAGSVLGALFVMFGAKRSPFRST